MLFQNGTNPINQFLHIIIYKYHHYKKHSIHVHIRLINNKILHAKHEFYSHTFEYVKRGERESRKLRLNNLSPDKPSQAHTPCFVPNLLVSLLALLFYLFIYFCFIL